MSNETDNDLSILTSIIQEELELARSGDGYEEMAVAESIVREKVAPMLAAKDRDVEQIRIRLAQTLNLPHSRTLDQLIDDVSEVFSGWVRMAREIGGLRRELRFTEATRQQYVEERDEALDDVERLRPALSKALADLVVRRQALANVLGVTDAGGVSGYYRMIQDVADLRAELGAIRARAQLAEDERDKANRQNESLARRLHLRFQNEQKLSAELGGARDLLGELELYVSWRYITGKLTTEQRELWADAVERWNPDPSDTPPPRQVDRWWRDDAPVGQPRAVYHDPGDLQYEYDEDDNPTDPSVGWDLTFGCRVSFSHDSDGYRATVSISDQTQRDGIAVRGVTRDQIRAYAYQLIRLTEVVVDGTQ